MPDGLSYIDKDFFVCFWVPPFNWSASHTVSESLYCQILKFNFFQARKLSSYRYSFHFLITIFFFLDFCLSSVNNLIFRTCQLLSSSHFGFCQKKFFLSIFDSFPQKFNSTLLGNYIWLLNFLVNPSCTATDEYCHKAIFQYRMLSAKTR